VTVTGHEQNRITSLRTSKQLHYAKRLD